MDKNIYLRRLVDIKTRPAVCHSVRELAEILAKVVNELPDREPKRLSLAEALEAQRDGERVQHESWGKRSYMTQVGDCFFRTDIDSDIVDDRIRITTDMLTGWIVLDK